MIRDEQMLSLSHNYRNAGLNPLVISEVCQQLSRLSTDGNRDPGTLLLERDVDAQRLLTRTPSEALVTAAKHGGLQRGEGVGEEDLPCPAAEMERRVRRGGPRPSG